ncbi:hypothetical protein [Polyangium mundeleinium]|uniref:Uncharacterized protein n=1 Tax=Polyangium mundeleinium TaxID=2995306 RepID=A0ABT5EHS3_9BACT|nr:hypothetical protein [Polyangium mundeleinium]MDC0740932.1 hypothetical protein [Polyangium mundeleinium]
MATWEANHLVDVGDGMACSRTNAYHVKLSFATAFGRHERLRTNCNRIPGRTTGVRRGITFERVRLSAAWGSSSHRDERETRLADELSALLLLPNVVLPADNRCLDEVSRLAVLAGEPLEDAGILCIPITIDQYRGRLERSIDVAALPEVIERWQRMLV